MVHGYRPANNTLGYKTVLQEGRSVMDLFLQMFNNFHAGLGKHKTITNIFRGAFGDEYAEKALPFSYVTKTELKNAVKQLNVGKGQTVVDLGCGHGGPGLWVVSKNEANLIGLDMSDKSIENATKRIEEFSLVGEVRFQIANFNSTGLPDDSCDGVISFDVILFLPNPAKGFQEVGRILKPGAKFVFTSWELDLPDRLNDHRPLLEDAGFSIHVYKDAEKGWKNRQRKVFEETLKSEETLIQEMSADLAGPWILDAKIGLPLLDRMQRIFVVAEKI